eukprot:c19860_g1_i3.p1 GENE.c19860_g1_i3~~c19860_g1_i3.p1  ORF type:complete len:444 (+),score=147.18 c19860_g1_i3:123-1454(+)
MGELSQRNQHEESEMEGDEEDIVLYNAPKHGSPDVIPEIRGATLSVLVNKLTSEEFVDPNFTYVFLLTYRSFTTGKDLIHRLKARFFTPFDDNDTNKISPVQLRVVNVIRQWLENYFDDFDSDDDLLAMVVSFISEHIEQTKNLAGLARVLKKVLERKLQGQERQLASVLTPAPRSRLSRFRKSMSTQFATSDDTLLQHDPADIAAQLTIISSKVFRRIQAKEFLNQNWSKNPELAPNITEIINRFNTLSLWVECEVLSSDDAKKRANTLTKMIRIAKECEKLQNYNDAKSLVAGIYSAAVYRLKRTWEKLKDRDREALEGVNKLLDGGKNFADLRKHLATLEPPTIPYLGMFLTDLVFIEQGNSNFIKDHNNIINFEKRRRMAFVIRQVKQLQQDRYALEENKALQELLLDLPVEKTQAETYALSLQLEPRMSQQSFVNPES